MTSFNCSRTRARVMLPLAIVAALAAACGEPIGPKTGALVVQVAGLPAGASAAVTATGPDGVARAITATDTLTDLPPGDYAIAAQGVTTRGSVYTASPTATTARVVAGPTAAQAAVAYALTTGSLTIEAIGLGAGARATFIVSGNALSYTVAAGDTLAGLPAGRYTVAAMPVTTPADSWAPEALGQEVEVVVSPVPARATVRFALTTGRIALGVRDLPAALGAAVTVTGPNNYSHKIDGAATITGLVPGRYTIAAAGGMVSGEAWIGQPASQQVDVVAGSQPAMANVRFMPRPPLDLAVAGVTVVQAVQRADNSVPLVADRPAMLRVFAQASEPNAVRPRVRVRWYVDGALRETLTLDAPNGAVPTERNDAELFSSWNATIPAALMRPGASVLVDVDPAAEIRESDETNNVYPATAALPLDVRAVPPLRIRFVPIAMTTAGTTGGVAPDNVGRFLDMTLRVMPVGSVEPTVSEPFLTSAAALQPNDGNGAWGQILSELRAARAAESATDTWYGVVRAPYTSGVAGMGYIGHPAAMGWDYLPSGSNVTAHELGHTWGRFHAPCGSVAGADSQYPYVGGFTGHWGLDLVSLRLRGKFSTDLMGYCNDPWISDYTWSGVLAFREARGRSETSAGSAGSVVSAGGEQPGLLVWGRVTAAGETILEPAFAVRARPALPARAGAIRVRGLAADGTELLSLAFDPTPVGEGGGGSFAFVVPMDEAQQARLATLRLTGPRGERRASARASRAEAVAERTPGGGRRVRWDAAAHPAALIRDPATGRVLGVARGGVARLPNRGRLELTLSDGVRSRVVRID